ncbi:MAG: GNAT family N-acetyltransferase [Cellulomonadaceae bacterium]|nr:GNAT family N-acetyltransferase [Cellulomonadaceae bacterium]
MGWVGVVLPFGALRHVRPTDVGNVAEQQALGAAGFQREGVIRGGRWRAGQWHDQVLYSVLRTEG